MPKNSIIFLRHAESKIDCEIPVSKWDSHKRYNIYTTRNIWVSEFMSEIK